MVLVGIYIPAYQLQLGLANPSSLVFLKCMHTVMLVLNLSYPA